MLSELLCCGYLMSLCSCAPNIFFSFLFLRVVPRISVLFSQQFSFFASSPPFQTPTIILATPVVGNPTAPISTHVVPRVCLVPCRQQEQVFLHTLVQSPQHSLPSSTPQRLSSILPPSPPHLPFFRHGESIFTFSGVLFSLPMRCRRRVELHFSESLFSSETLSSFPGVVMLWHLRPDSRTSSWC